MIGVTACDNSEAPTPLFGVTRDGFEKNNFDATFEANCGFGVSFRIDRWPLRKHGVWAVNDKSTLDARGSAGRLRPVSASRKNCNDAARASLRTATRSNFSENYSFATCLCDSIEATSDRQSTGACRSRSNDFGRFPPRI